MTSKPPKLKPSEILLPARMSLNLNALREVAFASLDFPIEKELKQFQGKLTERYNAKQGKGKETALDYEKKPPFRQLNMAIMACCPVLVHAFEQYADARRMVAINRLERLPDSNAIIDAGNQFPDVDALTDLIELWIDHWLEDSGLKLLVDETMSADLAALKTALRLPKTQWKTDVTLDELIVQLDQNDALGYNVIPAAVIALLHEQTITLQHGKSPSTITWRKAHDGGPKGLHLVSQPIYGTYIVEKRGKDGEKREVERNGYFVYRLDVRLQTQVGRMENNKLIPWIFLDVGMRRYAREPFKKDSQPRNLSVLLGFNREKILPENRDKMARFPYDTTLIALPIETRAKPKVWGSRLAQLLSSYGLSALEAADSVLNAPAKHGNLENIKEFNGNEYYIIHAEGRAYSNEDDEDHRYGHGHRVKIGFSLKEITEIIQRVLGLLPDVLIPDIAFEPDIKAPQGANVPLTLRDYEFFEPGASHTSERKAKKANHTLDAIRRAVQATGKDCLDIALLCSDTAFLEAAKAKIRRMFPNWESGETPFIRLHYDVPVSPLLQRPLDPGNLDPKDYYNPNRSKDFYEKWREQMTVARPQKVEEWRSLLKRISWRSNAHRVALIESYYDVDGFKAVDESQEIKGAIREACSREGVASQFIGHFEVEVGKDLSNAKDGKLENAILDLLLRGTGAIYGTPADLYARAAELSPSRVSNLDVVAFWHVQKSTALRGERPPLITVGAVRLRADGHTEILAPGLEDWLPYAQASAILGTSFANLRSKIRNKQEKPQDKNHLRMSNEEVMRFVMDVLQHHLDAPTIAVIQADWWRNARTKFDKVARWSQLGNKRLFAAQNILDFSHIPGGEEVKRTDPRFANLLAVIRLRMGSETPQYTTGTLTWDAAAQIGDLDHLSGYVDCTVTEPLHYFSVAGESDLQKDQSKGELDGGYKTDIDRDYAYKHAQLVELLPFFVRDDFRNEADRKVLCRCVHFLRVSPAFSKAIILLPYPMHLAKVLLDDLMCIVDAD